jgi:hypothetical protein
VPSSRAALSSLWEKVYRSASKEQQGALLELSARQGVVYAHQLNAERNGAGSAVEQGNSILTCILDGRAAELEPVRPQCMQVTDEALDAAQRDAVAKALTTPDLCLLRGLPGTGKSRVVAEVLIQAAARGERTLLSGQSSAAVDRVLEIVSGREEVYAIRCLGPGEAVEALPASVRKLTPIEQQGHWSQFALKRAREEARAGEQCVRRLREEEPVWDRLIQLAQQLTALEAEIDVIDKRRNALQTQVEQEGAAAESHAADGSVDSFAGDLMAFIGCQTKSLQQAEALLSVQRGCLDQLQRDREALKVRRLVVHRLVEAKRRWRCWRKAWWQAIFQRGLAAELQNLEVRIRENESACDMQAHELQLLVAKRAQAVEALDAGRQERITAEVVRRRKQLDRQAESLRRTREILERHWRESWAKLDPNGSRPAAPTRDAVQLAKAAWDCLLHEQQQCLELDRKWLDCLADTSAMCRHLLECANLVAATTACLRADGDPALSENRFDLLVLQDADQVQPAELYPLLRRASRWLLVGEPLWEGGNGQPHVEASILAQSKAIAPRYIHNPRQGRGIFSLLWQQLHVDPRGLPYRWSIEAGRLCCRFQEIAPEHRLRLETERVADRPDVELRILALPNALSSLAEIAFPSSFSIGEAKTYVYKELQELTVAAAGQSMSWSEYPDLVALNFSGAKDAEIIPCHLEPGVTELVTCRGGENSEGRDSRCWETVRLVFDKADGWDRARAEEWVSRYLGLRDLGRTIYLDVSHRMHPDLAAFVSHVLIGADYRYPSGSTAHSREGEALLDAANGSSARVQFVPVPPLRRETSPQTKVAKPHVLSADTVRALPGTGAGLELNLADPRHCERLPRELCSRVVDGGFANYSEAQAVIRTLDALASGPSAKGRRARQRVGVMALYRGQVELIRCLAKQSPVLSSGALDVEIGLPATFREREYPLVILSLTRSHPHRAVTFGESPLTLALALTRARAQLLIFGDPGALAQRRQWAGHLDHLDDSAAAFEHEVVSRLVDYLQGRGRHPRAFHLREGHPS